MMKDDVSESKLTERSPDCWVRGSKLNTPGREYNLIY